MTIYYDLTLFINIKVYIGIGTYLQFTGTYVSFKKLTELRQLFSNYTQNIILFIEQPISYYKFLLWKRRDLYKYYWTLHFVKSYSVSLIINFSAFRRDGQFVAGFRNLTDRRKRLGWTRQKRNGKKNSAIGNNSTGLVY